MMPSPVHDGSPRSMPFSGNQNHNGYFEEDQKPTLTPMEQSAAERLQRLMRDCGYSTDRLQNMYDELPPRKLRDDLVNYYFDVMFV